MFMYIIHACSDIVNVTLFRKQYVFRKLVIYALSVFLPRSVRPLFFRATPATIRVTPRAIFTRPFVLLLVVGVKAVKI